MASRLRKVNDHAEFSGLGMFCRRLKMALLPFTHVLRRKTDAGYTLTKGLLVEGVGFMMVSPKHEGTKAETGIYRIVCDLSDCEVLPSGEALAQGWFDKVTKRRQMFEEAMASAT
jgi:hypothetical protein